MSVLDILFALIRGIVADRAELAAEIGGGELGPDPLGRLRVDGHGVLLRSLADGAGPRGRATRLQ